MTKKDIKKIMKNKIFQAVALVTITGFVLANFWSILGYAALGIFVTVAGTFAYGLYEEYALAKKAKK